MPNPPPEYPPRYAVNVEQFRVQTTPEERTFIFHHLVGPLRQEFPHLDDVALGTLACQLYPGLGLDVLALASALATAVHFLLDTYRITAEQERETSQKISGVLRIFLPHYLQQFPDTSSAPTLH